MNNLISGLVAKYRKVLDCKYGENAQQKEAALYSTDSDDPLALDKFRLQEGTPPSFVNMTDLDRMIQTMTHISAAFPKEQNLKIAIGVKHGNTCGAAVHIARNDAFAGMLKGDPRALMGGFVMTNFGIDEQTLAACFEPGKKVLFDGVVTPGITSGALDLLRRRGDKCRFITNPALACLNGAECLDWTKLLRPVRGGFLVQPNYTFVPDFRNEMIKKVCGETSDIFEMDMMLAWAIGSTSNSNTVTLVKSQRLIGNGVGQQDRVGGAELAIKRARDAGHDVKDSVAYSDSFFPFSDGPAALIKAGVRAIFTSSGSIRDQETIDLCLKSQVALYMVPDAEGRGFFGH